MKRINRSGYIFEEASNDREELVLRCNILSQNLDMALKQLRDSDDNFDSFDSELIPCGFKQ